MKKSPTNTPKNLPLKGKVSLVTGAAKRVGKAIALELARNGSDIALHYHTSRKEALLTKNEIEENWGVAVYLVQGDLAKSKDIAELVMKTHVKFNQLDILVNSASIFKRTPFANLTERDFDEHIAINLKAPYLLSKLCGDIMLKQKHGIIINISDWSGLHPTRHYLPYFLSKGGMIALTSALANELAPYVRVNCVAPGPVLLQENISESEKESLISKTLLKRLGSPEEVAKAVLFLVKDATYTTGAVIPVEGGLLCAAI